MTLKGVPLRVRALVYAFWVGMASAGLGVLGFFLSFRQVGSPVQAAIDVQTTVPTLAYASILAWGVGLGVMWVSRRRIDAAVAAKLAENCDEVFIDVNESGVVGASSIDGASADLGA